MRKINEITHKLGINSHKLYFALLILRSTSKSTRMFEMTNKINNIAGIELDIVTALQKSYVLDEYHKTI